MAGLSVRRIISATVLAVFMGTSLGACTIVLSTPQATTSETTTASDAASSPSAAVPAEDPAAASTVNTETTTVPSPEEDQDVWIDDSTSEDRIALPAGAHPAAGGPIPPQARPITAFNYGVAIITSPSGNIGCDLDENYPGCGVLSMIDSGIMGTNEIGDPNWWVGFATTGIPEVTGRGDVPVFSYGDVSPQVVEYGEIVHHAGIVCASEEDGMTCWNSWTSHGVFMNKRGMTTF